MIAPGPLRACVVVLSAFMLASEAHSQPILVVALGDTNTAGFGVGRENAFPARLEAMLRQSGYDVQVANAGISGDTLGGTSFPSSRACCRAHKVRRPCGAGDTGSLHWLLRMGQTAASRIPDLPEKPLALAA